jgi:hypothetical protein
MSVVDKIVAEWAFRCKKGYPDMNNPADMKILKEIYSQFGITVEAKESQNPNDYIYIPGGEEDQYVRVQDFDTKTKKPKPGAQLYRLVKKEKGRGAVGAYKPILSDHKKGEEDTDNPPVTDENQYVVSILRQAGVPEELIQNTLQNPNYKKAADIPDFIKNKQTYIDAFENLYKYKVPRGGLGELVPLVSIQKARIGGANEKDITAQGKVLEIKELAKGEGVKEFALASTAGIAGSKFQEHLETFKKAITPFRTLPEFRLVYIGLTDVNKVPKEYLLTLEKLLSNFPYTKESLDKQSTEIKIGSKKYLITKGSKYTLELDDEGNLVQTDNAPKEADQEQSNIRKLLNHPWVQQRENTSPVKDLEDIKKNYLQSIDYLMLWTSSTSAEIIDAKAQAQLPDAESIVKINRVALGNLTLAYSTKK